MLAQWSGLILEVHAPAKLNLLLEIHARRGDGFHEIETLMVPVWIVDTLFFRSESAPEIDLKVEWSVAGPPADKRLRQLPQGRDNLVVRAVELLRRRSGIGLGASMRLVKRIPLAAGLGGGSSDAAAALLAANQAWNLNFSPERLRELAAELGSDVPFFLGGGPAVCRGRGELVEPVDGLGRLHFVVVQPPAGLSTAEVYAACRAERKPAASARLVEALRRGDAAGAGRLLHNGLQPAAERISPWIARLREEFGRIDCLGHQMSGSGSSYFGICRHARHARQVAGQLRSRALGSVYAVSSC